MDRLSHPEYSARVVGGDTKQSTRLIFASTAGGVVSPLNAPAGLADLQGVKMQQRNQLLSLCARERSRVRISRPFAVDWGGHTWDCATDGRAALLVRSATWPLIADSPDVAGQVMRSIDDCGHLLRVSGLLEYSFGEPAVCKHCDGHGRVGDEYAPEGTSACPCDNGLPRGQWGSVGDMVFNRRLLYKFLLIAGAYDRSAEHTIKWHDSMSAAFVGSESGDTMVALMPAKIDVANAVSVESTLGV